MFVALALVALGIECSRAQDSPAPDPLGSSPVPAGEDAAGAIAEIEARAEAAERAGDHEHAARQWTSASFEWAARNEGRRALAAAFRAIEASERTNHRLARNEARCALGSAHLRLGNLHASRSALETVLAAPRWAQSPQILTLAHADLGQALEGLDLPAPAAEHYRLALAGGDRPDRVRALRLRLAGVETATRNLDVAERLLDEVEANDGRESIDTLTGRLGIALAAGEDPLDAMERLLESARVAKDDSTREGSARARSFVPPLILASDGLRAAGWATEAEALARAALELARASEGAAERAMAGNALALAQVGWGGLAEARRTLEESAVAARECAETHPRPWADILTHLAAISIELGELGAALDLAAELCIWCEANELVDEGAWGEFIDLRAELDRMVRDGAAPSQWQETLERAEALAEELRARDDAARERTARSLAATLAWRTASISGAGGLPDADVDGLLAKARSHLDRIESLLLDREDPYWRPWIENGIAECQLVEREFSKARERAQRSVERTAAESRPEIRSRALYTLARAAFGEGDLGTARDATDAAIAVLELRAPRGLDPDTLGTYRAQFGEIALFANDLSAERIRRAEPAGIASEEISAFGRAARWQERAMLNRLHRGEDSGARAAPSGDGAALLADLRATFVDADTLLVNYFEGRERLYAVSVTSESTRWFTLSPLAIVRERAGRLLRGISVPGAQLSPPDVIGAARDLARSVLDPILAAHRDAPRTRLVIVPDRALTGVPFEALMTAAPDGASSFSQVEFVLDRHATSYGLSAATLVDLARRPRRESRGPLLLVGDPIGADEPGSAVSRPLDAAGDPFDGLVGPVRSSGAPRLLHARDEARSIWERFATDADRAQLPSISARSLSFDGERIELRLGAHANRSVFARSLSRYSVVHVVSHGLFLPDQPERAALVLSGSTDRERLLTLEQAAALDLDAELVVLSACDSGRSDWRPGDGVDSLAIAFLVAGARRTIASLWPVDDEATAELFDRFYAPGQRGSFVDLLTAAKRGLCERTLRGVGGIGTVGGAPRERIPAEAHPFFWAAFVHFGDPR